MSIYSAMDHDINDFEVPNRYQPADILNMTLPEALKMCIDGTKVCHDDYDHKWADKIEPRFMLFEFPNIVGGSESGARYPIRLDTLPKSGWYIYKEPVVTYKDAEKVMAAVFAGERLYTNWDSMGEWKVVALTLYKNEDRCLVVDIFPAQTPISDISTILSLISTLEWRNKRYE